MQNSIQRSSVIPRPIAIWLVGFIAVAAIGTSIAVDLTGQSAADQYVLARWSFGGLRAYLWLEGGVFAAVVAALGIHIASSGLALARGGDAGGLVNTQVVGPRLQRQGGYIVAVLGATLVVMSFASLVVLNSCRYMRLI